MVGELSRVYGNILIYHKCNDAKITLEYAFKWSWGVIFLPTIIFILLRNYSNVLYSAINLATALGIRNEFAIGFESGTCYNDLKIQIIKNTLLFSQLYHLFQFVWRL